MLLKLNCDITASPTSYIYRTVCFAAFHAAGIDKFRLLMPQQSGMDGRVMDGGGIAAGAISTQQRAAKSIMESINEIECGACAEHLRFATECVRVSRNCHCRLPIALAIARILARICQLSSCGGSSNAKPPVLRVVCRLCMCVSTICIV